MFLGLELEVVGEANDGAETLQLARQLRPDVVIMNLLMPVMDGIEATAAIRRELPDIEQLSQYMGCAFFLGLHCLLAGGICGSWLTCDAGKCGGCTSKEKILAARISKFGQVCTDFEVKREKCYDLDTALVKKCIVPSFMT